MPNVAIRGVPEELHRDLKAAAERNHRSLNGEILSRLTASVRPFSVDAVVLLERIRRRHKTLGPIDLDDAMQQARARGAGLPSGQAANEPQ